MLARATSSTPVTWDEFVGLPDDDRRELIDGVLVEVADDAIGDETFAPESLSGLEDPAHQALPARRGAVALATALVPPRMR